MPVNQKLNPAATIARTVTKTVAKILIEIAKCEI